MFKVCFYNTFSFSNTRIALGSIMLLFHILKNTNFHYNFYETDKKSVNFKFKCYFCENNIKLSALDKTCINYLHYTDTRKLSC